MLKCWETFLSWQITCGNCKTRETAALLWFLAKLLNRDQTGLCIPNFAIIIEAIHYKYWEQILCFKHFQGSLVR